VSPCWSANLGRTHSSDIALSGIARTFQQRSQPGSDRLCRTQQVGLHHIDDIVDVAQPRGICCREPRTWAARNFGLGDLATKSATHPTQTAPAGKRPRLALDPAPLLLTSRGWPDSA
jgi:hypothetical protein